MAYKAITIGAPTWDKKYKEVVKDTEGYYITFSQVCAVLELNSKKCAKFLKELGAEFKKPDGIVVFDGVEPATKLANELNIQYVKSYDYYLESLREDSYV